MFDFVIIYIFDSGGSCYYYYSQEGYIPILPYTLVILEFGMALLVSGQGKCNDLMIYRCQVYRSVIGC